MLKYISILLFSSSMAFSATTILERRVTSGFVLPEHSFVKTCKIYKEGFMEALITRGDGTSSGNSNLVPKWRIKLIQGLLRLARRGKMEDGPIICDGGDDITKGYLSNGNLVELDISLDCAASRVNTSSATPYLVNIAKDICAF